MNQPGPGTRWMGSPSGSACVLISCALVMAGVFAGELPWWLALFALGFANGTAGARKQVQTYDAWAARWNLMATGETAPEAPQKQPRRKRSAALDVLVGMALMLGLPWLASVAADTQGERQFLAVLWLVDIGYLVFLAVRGFARPRSLTRSAAKPVELQPVEDKAVAWLVETPSESPSRADAERELPEYCAGMISVGEDRRERP